MQPEIGVFLPTAIVASVHLNKFYYSTFIFLYGWNKTFKILALVQNDLFKGKHICRAVIKVSPGHLSEPLGYSLSEEFEQKLGPAA